jgi:transcriptional regulator with XRE-family HTH domain
MSSGPSSHPDPVLSARGLPDFAALLAAELAAASEGLKAQATSSLGAGEIVLSARELSGLSQRALASRARTVQAVVSAIETGNRLPTIRTLVRLVEAAGYELVVGLRRPGASAPAALGALVSSRDDDLADYVPLTRPSPFEGAPDRSGR